MVKCTINSKAQDKFKDTNGVIRTDNTKEKEKGTLKVHCGPDRHITTQTI